MTVEDLRHFIKHVGCPVCVKHGIEYCLYADMDTRNEYAAKYGCICGVSCSHCKFGNAEGGCNAS